MAAGDTRPEGIADPREEAALRVPRRAAQGRGEGERVEERRALAPIERRGAFQPAPLVAGVEAGEGVHGVGRDGADVHEARDAVVCSCRCDDRSAVGMTDEDCGTADPAERTFDHGDIGRVGVETILHGERLVAVRLQQRNDLVEARAIGPDAVAEYDAGLCAVHWLSSCVGQVSHAER